MRYLSKALVPILLLSTPLFADKEFKHRVGGQIAVDSAWYFNDDKNQNDQEIRRARLFLKSKLNKVHFFEIEYSFTNDGEFKDLYYGYSPQNSNLTFIFGQSKIPFSIEALTSSKYNTFMERSTLNSLIPDRKVGAKISYNNSKKHLFGYGATIGAFSSSVEDISDNDGEYIISSRLYGARYFDKDSFYHFGFSALYSDNQGKKLKLRARPESHMAKKFLKTKIKGVDSSTIYGAEMVVGLDSLTFESEYLYDSIDSSKQGDYSFSGWYAQIGYFLTGEHKRYSLKEGIFKRVKVDNPASGSNYLKGAIESAFRVSYLDLNDKDERGGESYIYTFALNWYLTNHFRTLLDYSVVDKKESDDKPKELGLRVLYDF